MPYSITTQDGITIDNIPDDVPADAPQLKERVARIRGEKAPQQPAAQKPPGVEAPRSGYLMGLRDPIDALAQIAENLVPDSVSTKVNKFNNYLADQGLPLARVEESPQGTTKLVQQVNQKYDQQRQQGAQTVQGLVTGAPAEPGLDWGRLAGNIFNPATMVLSPSAAGARTITQLAGAGARAGAMGGILTPETSPGSEENFWGRKAGQAALGAIGGAVVTPVASRAVEGVARGVGAARRAVAARNIDPQQVLVASANAARSVGQDWAQLPPAMQQMVREQVEQSMRSGQRLDPAAIMRRVEAESVGLTGDAALTTGQVTRDPGLFTQERNLRGVQISTPQGRGNPLMDRFANQNRVLTENFDQLGAGQATEPALAGQTLIGALRAADEPVRAGVDEAYGAARAMNSGRAAPLERGTFSQQANAQLDAEMRGRFLPPEVRALLNDISSGQTPFDVDAAAQIDSILSAAQRAAARRGDDAGAGAVRVVRDALRNTPLAATDLPDGGAGQAAREAFDAARGGGPRPLCHHRAHPSACRGH